VRLGLIGHGAVATLALDAMARALPRPVEALICYVRTPSSARAADWAERYRGVVARDILIVDDLDGFLAAQPSVVAEAAGHGALAEAGLAVLAAGIDLIVSSVGVMADEILHARLLRAAAQSGAELVLSPGAVGGLDILAAARLAGLHGVTYTSRKPPLAWRGTAAETMVDLPSLQTEAVFFEGNAGEAARAFPQNANVAATIALAGVGLDATRVRLVADPAVRRNVHEIDIRSACADVTIRIEGHPAPDNPKTSTTTGYSLARLLLDRAQG
jgi:aspartate dehydrogenase